jgi:hypothetical protein
MVLAYQDDAVAGLVNSPPGLTFLVVTLVALGKIVRKAGYSGWWLSSHWCPS